MKPRLEVAPLTPEDTSIWCRVILSMPGAHAGQVFANSGFRADRGDADTMLSLESHKANGAPRYLIRAGQLCGFGGPFRAFVNLPVYGRPGPMGDITNFA